MTEDPTAGATVGIPDWDLEQLEVIMDDPASWQLVIAPPGAGKSAVACQRIAFLIDDGIPASRVLVISFTRTAVAELRTRIEDFAVAGDRARGVRISTIDAHAWSLRYGFEDQTPLVSMGDGSYEKNIEETLRFFQCAQPDLIEFIRSFEHLIVDEAQDVMSKRAELLSCVLDALSDTCGVTILADPEQAIYGFTTDDVSTIEGGSSFLSILDEKYSARICKRHLSTLYRIRDDKLLRVFEETRSIVSNPEAQEEHIKQVIEKISETSPESIGRTRHESVAAILSDADDESTLVLFRRRADALYTSSFCSEAGTTHRLRLSATETIIKPWIGWLFSEETRGTIDRTQFTSLWRKRQSISEAPFATEDNERCWKLLCRYAAGRREGVLDLVYLRRILKRSRAPGEFCVKDMGTNGPTIGTIHASKGRESERVLLVLPSSTVNRGEIESENAMFEEGRVYYVGATRARNALVVATNRSLPVRYLNSRRVYRRLPHQVVQLEIGRIGDVDPYAHLAWNNSLAVQRLLAAAASEQGRASITARSDLDYALRIVLEHKCDHGIMYHSEIGQMSDCFRHDLNEIWSIVDVKNNLRPSTNISHLYLFGVTTVVLDEKEMQTAATPFRSSGFALAPVIKGFARIKFVYRKKGA